MPIKLLIKTVFFPVSTLLFLSGIVAKVIALGITIGLISFAAMVGYFWITGSSPF